MEVDTVAAERSHDAIAAWVAAAMDGHAPCLLGLDAPLGWPQGLAESLRDHAAGSPIAAGVNDIARRHTDNVIAEAIGKRPLDVGADRIARTAHATLALLADVRGRLSAAVELAWTPGRPQGAGALEVYPGGTLAARGLSARGYKRGDGARAAREALLDRLAPEWTVPDVARDKMLGSEHLFDAALCVLAAADFARGEVIAPDDADRALARREGWIWVKQPGPTRT